MELLVRTVNKESPDPGNNIQLTKRGDVISYHLDGGSWGIEELLNPEWIILQVVDMTVEQAESMLQPEFPPESNPGQPVLKRIYAIDLNTMGIFLSARTATYDADQRVIADFVVPVELVAANIIIKPPSIDPNGIGPVESMTIGPK